MFYVLIGLGSLSRHADLFIVLTSWVFLITPFHSAGVFVTSNDLGRRSIARLAGMVVLMAMWAYFSH